MKNVKFFRGEDLPLELHKVRVVQKLHLVKNCISFLSNVVSMP